MMPHEARLINKCRHTIHLLTTGGTIDKSFDEESSVFINKQNITEKEIKKNIRLPYTKIKTQHILEKDSLDLTYADRLLIIKKIQAVLKNHKFEPIVVLHGTDTMTETAKTCQQKIITPEVPIVFTGAIVPFNLKQSDALQNIIEAFTSVKLLASGIYISFHGEIFLADAAIKNYKKGTFEYK